MSDPGHVEIAARRLSRSLIEPVGHGPFDEEIADCKQAIVAFLKRRTVRDVNQYSWVLLRAIFGDKWKPGKGKDQIQAFRSIPRPFIGPEAVHELRRTVSELGFVGAMLPSRGLPFDVGHKTYWPIYAERERLGCALGVHGGAHHNMGLDTFETFVPIHALGHPFSSIIALNGMVYHGVFNRFPKLRVGFLVGWVTFWMDRLDRSHSYHIELNLRSKYLSPAADQRPSEYVKNGQVFIGCEGNEEGLAYQIQRKIFAI